MSEPRARIGAPNVVTLSASLLTLIPLSCAALVIRSKTRLYSDALMPKHHPLHGIQDRTDSVASMLLTLANFKSPLYIQRAYRLNSQILY